MIRNFLVAMGLDAYAAMEVKPTIIHPVRTMSSLPYSSCQNYELVHRPAP